ncbi:hypothetical protein FNV43_RR02259 [Rhamnella rubrinervis]|uniref:Uncharacterized protein n=1 Tax=Rhamnella rubrinervis TaxID=2594499 RepID=A0A8K0HS10_9ROSA|nr:hypothetical protein FNV43_RR02259 [Rhamnella rubrinervis]
MLSPEEPAVAEEAVHVSCLVKEKIEAILSSFLGLVVSWVPNIANIILRFTIEHTWTMWSYLPRAIVAFRVISLGYVNVEIVKRIFPLERAIVLRRPPKVWSEMELEIAVEVEHLDS